jgi:hypothetical protein
MFAVIVAVLAIVGVYLTMRPGSGGGDEDARVPARATPAAAKGGASPPATRQATAQGPFDVYGYLPLSKDEIAASADMTQRFMLSYATFRYDEDPISYAERLKQFTTNELGASLTRTVTSPGLVQRNKTDQIVSQGSARVKSIRDMSTDSIVWVVGATERITAKSGKSERTDDYAVTLIRSGDAWRVYDLEPAGAGQDGDATEGGNAK